MAEIHKKKNTNESYCTKNDLFFIIFKQVNKSNLK